jgi:hypothetical protein
LPATKFIKHDAETPDVALETIWSVLHQFRTQIVGRTDLGGQQLRGTAQQARNPEVAQFYLEARMGREIRGRERKHGGKDQV